MTARVGNFIYWVACIAALLWAVFVLTMTGNLPHPDWTISTPIAIVGAALIWSFGVAARDSVVAISRCPGPFVYFPHQQNGKTLAILQTDGGVASVSRLRVFFGEEATFAAAFGIGCSSLVGDDPLSARIRLDSFLRHRYPIPNSIGLAPWNRSAIRGW